ncbi:MAG: alpha-amylase family glycosyl hydrolase [Acidimicrobiia bacterium]|nr:alpha-amylase family glycosyl hydrolase [Acidimicrobiia bacterium]
MSETAPDVARAFAVAADARSAYDLEDEYFVPEGPLAFADDLDAQELAARVNDLRRVDRYPERAVGAGDLMAAALIQEITRIVLGRRLAASDRTLESALDRLAHHLGEDHVDALLTRFASRYPPTPVYRGATTPDRHLQERTDGKPNRRIAVEELIMLRLANENPGFERFVELCDDEDLEATETYEQAIAALEEYFADEPGDESGGDSLFEVLRAPMRSNPTSLLGQLEYIRANWSELLGDRFGRFLQRILRTIDAIHEEQADRGGMGTGPPPVLDAGALRATGQSERFTDDRSWMPSVVLMAKSTYVWLDQLSKRHGRAITRLDEIPDEELDALAAGGFTGLWLIGLWERSEASRRIKRRRGDAEAEASAYALYDYEIAAELGGHEAYERLRDRAWARGLRLAADMVPNHVGIDGRWVVEHPDWFVQVDEPPFPGYSFDGPDLSSDDRVAIQIEDHYWDGTDAAVVFKRTDRMTGEARYLYHGNDGTSMPWNDTAQLDYLKAEVRAAVVDLIKHVARRFPIIRFDAAMTLAKQHIQRLWYPAPGTGGAIPSRSRFGMTEAEFDRHMPTEFWREVVDTINEEMPDTLLLAEAFWMLEGYFVRTLGMHRVYNSAFMHMTSKETNAEYRQLMKNVLEFDPEILKRFVNFMNNPDEETAAVQFGTGDKYFGVATLMATLPGLPMFGHGQVEGFREKYGMEFRRARWNEPVDEGLLERHRREIFPVLHRRRQFAEATDFLLFDFVTGGGVDENVYAYANRVDGDRSLVLYNNAYTTTTGRLQHSLPYRDKAAGGDMRSRTLADGMGLRGGDADLLRGRDLVTGHEHLWRARDVADVGLAFTLHAYQRHVFVDLREVRDASRPLLDLCDRLGGRGVASAEEELRRLEAEPAREALAGFAERPGESAAVALVEALAALGIPLPDRAASKLERIHRRVTTVLPAVAVGPPEFDPRWAAAVTAGVVAGPSALEALGPLPFDGAERWSSALPVVLERSEELTGWVRSRGSAAGLRRLLAGVVPGPASEVLRVHEHDGITWFDRDGYRTLARAAVLVALAGVRSPRPVDRAAELYGTWRRLEEGAAYRLDRLLGTVERSG